ncbi:Bug family tripartite tricarboxylate transporter substrate binding protein [Streptomyces sp. NRRL F-5126]|uniref:Bug family tripartite tricarboxylate transporter substrate binding protein n=1 Tax=Streptomyces sp. NRRL F-5126 TaxID=1463857 RepID=UPI0004C56275|nr:tripartite tricarboxylate transporter substrate-binding protein [Streptomyces sp. NRRL F-5126]
MLFHTFNDALRVTTCAVAGAVAVTVLTGCHPKGSSSSASGGGGSSFYSGKTLTIEVPYGPGGGYDQWARVIAPYMQKYTGAGSVKIVNTPGGGGLVGTQAIYHAPADGLTIGDTNAGGDVFDQIDHASGFNLDMRKVNWIGRPDDDPHIIATHTSGPYKTFDKLVGSKSKVSALATGKGSSDYNAAVIIYNAFKVPFKMVAAFSGSSAEKAAFTSGEGTSASLSSSDIASIPNSATSVVVVSATPFSKLPKVPTVIQEAKKHGVSGNTLQALNALTDVMDLGHSFFAPPGVPSARLKALRTAFKKSMDDTAFQKAAKKAGLYQGYESSSDLSAAVSKALSKGSLFDGLLKTS